MTTDITSPCAVCGMEGQNLDQHHLVPRGRAPDKRDDPTNLAYVCRPCHNRLEPEGSWRLQRQGDLWVTLDVATGETVCRRPAVSRGSQALTVIQRVGDLLDYRKNKEAILALLSTLPDSDLLLVDEWAGRVGGATAATRALTRYEAYMRHPLKFGAGTWAADIAKQFGVAQNTVYQDVRGAQFYAEDPGPPKDWSFYREALRSRFPTEETLRIMNEVWEQAGKVRDFREALGLTPEEPETCECAACGNVHNRRKA